MKFDVWHLLLNIRDFIKQNKFECFLLLIILAVAAFFRLYKIDQYMTFLGDEGRDVIIVRRIFTEVHPPLIGPGTSVGNMYLGPLYYYMMAPALLLANFSPVGPAVMIVILGVLTVFLIWFIGRKWFSKVAGLVSAGLYAISPTVIIFSRSSWNPNIMPFFALLSIYSIWRVWKLKEFKWMIVLGIAYAFVLQSHYLGLLLFPSLLIFWYLARVPKHFTRYAIFIFAILMSPLLIFDIRHNFINVKALYTLIATHDGTVLISVGQIISKIPVIFNQINTSLLAGNNILFGKILSLMIFVGCLYVIFKKKIGKLSPNYYLLISCIGFGLVGFAVYKLPIYDHYFGFLFPVPFLMIGAVIAVVQRGNSLLVKTLLYTFCLVLAIMNLINNPLRFQPNKQMARSQNVSKFILDQASGKPFDLAVLAERNYEDGYRYFLELWGGIVMHADRWDQKTIVDQLFVVCEMEEKKCDPTHSSKAEIANFGMSKIESQWQVDGVLVYKLVHSR